LNTEISAKNKIQAIGTVAIPVLRQSFKDAWTVPK
jgi:hypothetical protein